jgi:hypothetical protein
MGFRRAFEDWEMDVEQAAGDYASEHYDMEADQEKWELLFEAFKAGAEYKKALVEGLG